MSSSTTAYIHSYTDLCDYVGNYLSGYAQDGMSVDERREVARRLRDEDGHPAFGEDWSTWLDEHAERITMSVLCPEESAETATIKINIYRQGGDWYGARWIYGEYDGTDELDVAANATESEAREHALSMPLRAAGERIVVRVTDVG